VTSSEAVPEARPRRGRPPQISAEDILTAAANRLDGDWTVASVAAELGVSDAAIYRYFPSKKALLAAVSDRVLAEMPLPAYDGDWRALLTAMGHGAYNAFVRYPSLLDLDSWVGIYTTDSLASVEHMYDQVLRAGFDLADASAVLGAVASVSREYARLTVLATHAESAAGPLWDAETYPILTRVIPSSTTTADDVFDQALQIVIDGAAQRLPPARRRLGSRRPRP
jgi:AcrR family transcriptional regulator